MIHPKWWLVPMLSICVSLGFSQDAPEGRLMRFPDIYKDEVIFSYGGVGAGFHGPYGGGWRSGHPAAGGDRLGAGWWSCIVAGLENAVRRRRACRLLRGDGRHLPS